MPVLIRAVSLTDGDVAEIGTGIYSTPVLHWLCSPVKRRLYSFENDPKYIEMYNTMDYEDEYHKIVMVKDWDSMEIERPWDVVFVDHKPGPRRGVDAIRVANFAKLVVMHDANGRYEKQYGYKEVYPHYRYKYYYSDAFPASVVLSNFVDLKDFMG